MVASCYLTAVLALAVTAWFDAEPAGRADSTAQARPAAPARLAILIAEDRRAPTPNDVAVIRAGVRSQDPQTARIAVRALGRLERPALIPDIVPALKSPLPEIRAEAANAIGQAAQGWKASAARPAAPAAVTLDSAYTTLVARLSIEAEPSVRSALSETIGRLPYSTPDQVQRAEVALLETAHADSVIDQLGVAKGFEGLVRLHRRLKPPSPAAIARLRSLASSNGRPTGPDPARIRRLAFEVLLTAEVADEEAIARAASDSDAQVRRLAMRAAAASAAGGVEVLTKGLADEATMVRVEALRGLRPRAPSSALGAGPSTGLGAGGAGGTGCATSLAAASDRDLRIALMALDQLAACGAVPEAGDALKRTLDDLSAAGSPRGWHRPAHALVALAAAAPERATASLPQFTGSSIWQLRMYAARAAAILSDRTVLEKLAADEDDNVREAAIEGLKKAAGHAADATYIASLGRHGNQAVRAAASALGGTPNPDAALPALKAALQRLKAEGRDNSHDARAAIAGALNGLGSAADPPKPAHMIAQDRKITPALTAEDLRRLAAPRARVTIHGVGTFELVLFTAEAPATVLRFVHLAESGYYNGLTFHRVVPNFVIQGGSPGANEYVGDASFMRDELGLWPHVRGAVGISTRGRDTGDAQIFIDLVDNPRLDHEYTVFAQVLNGMDVVDQILEGDVIEKVEILTN